MQRNTSFFWASDALRALDDDDDENNDTTAAESVGLKFDDDDLATEHIAQEGRIEVTLDEEEGQPDHANSVENAERTALVGKAENYGAASSTPTATHNMSQRRKLFDKRKQFAVSFSDSTKQFSSTTTKAVRFQVVIWHIGEVDVQHGHVKMRFRITLFWNDNHNERELINGSSDEGNVAATHSVWAMEGRQRATRKDLQNEQVKETIDVPPISILNATKFDTVGVPEIAMVNEHNRLMRWTCMYNATLFQGDHFRVDQFPHDMHTLKLKIGILADRGTGGRWDHHLYRLDLAGEDDSQGSTRIPHGLIVDHVRAPDFSFNPDDLDFEFIPLLFGSGKTAREKDRYLQVTLPVVRESGHYDRSIIPILAMLNIIAITCLPRNFDSATASTETMLSIAFVQVGIRLTVDSRLPSVGYEIKMQRVMNQCFWLLSFLVLESNTVFFLVVKRGWDEEFTDNIDFLAACIAFLYNLYILCIYYSGKPSKKEKIP